MVTCDLNINIYTGIYTIWFLMIDDPLIINKIQTTTQTGNRWTTDLSLLEWQDSSLRQLAETLAVIPLALAVAAGGTLDVPPCCSWQDCICCCWAAVMSRWLRLAACCWINKVKYILGSPPTRTNKHRGCKPHAHLGIRNTTDLSI